jgi:hypothetical protein
LINKKTQSQMYLKIAVTNAFLTKLLDFCIRIGGSLFGNTDNFNDLSC